MSASSSVERPDWPRLRRWSEMGKGRRSFLGGLGAFLLLLGGLLAGIRIHETGRVWPAARAALLSLPIAGASFLVIGFYKVRRVGATLLSAAGLVAVLVGIWWAVPAERGLVTSAAEVATGLAACGLVFVPAVTGRIPAALGSAAVLAGLLFGIAWAFPALPVLVESLVAAGIEGVAWGTVGGLVLHAAERADMISFPWPESDSRPS